MSEEIFTRELDRRADHVHGVPLTVADVRGRARSIRRRRRSGAAAAVAAVVALMVLVPTVLSGDGRRAVEPAPPARPLTAYLHDGVVERSDGTRVDIGVDSPEVTQVSMLTDGRVVMAMQEPYAIRSYRPDGTLEAQFPAGANRLTTSADGTAIAWVAKDRTIRVLTSGTPEPAVLPGIPMPGESAGTIDAVLDADHLLVGDYTRTTGEITPAGFEERTWSEPMWVSDVSPDGELWAVDLPAGANEQFGCAGLYHPGADAVVARTCDTSYLRFAPDGQHLLGSRGDNNMVGEAQVLDLDLQRVWSSRVSGAVVSRLSWAGDDDLYVAMTDLTGQDWQLVRERAVPPLDDQDPVVLDGPAPGGNPEMVSEYLFSS